MNTPRLPRRIALLLAATAMLLGFPAVFAAAASAATGNAAGTATAAGTGWIRLAHLSPNTPAVDVYLYSFGNPDARIVLHHISYGTVSPYESVPEGDYSVAMRMAGAGATTPPVLSASTWIASGHAYTAAALGPESGLRIQIMTDDLTTPAGRALVRVVQASLKQPKVTVSWDGKVIVSQLPFASVTSYQAVSPGTENVTLRAGADHTTSAVSLAAGAIHTLVVLDGSNGLEVANLEDAAGSATMPAGGVQTGFGGTAAHGPGSPLPWLAVIAAGSLLTLAGGLARRRHPARHPA